MKLTLPKVVTVTCALSICTVGVMYLDNEYVWYYGGEIYHVSADCSDSTYADGNGISTEYITGEDPAIDSLAQKLYDVTSDLSDIDRAQCLLAFVQQCIIYKSDMSQWDVEDYRQSPAQTMELRTGDCEDTAYLYASIMWRLGYDISIFNFTTHCAVGICLDGASGTSYEAIGQDKMYYLCETTDIIPQIGHCEYDTSPYCTVTYGVRA
jgi:hypothetical protein